MISCVSLTGTRNVSLCPLSAALADLGENGPVLMKKASVLMKKESLVAAAAIVFLSGCMSDIIHPTPKTAKVELKYETPKDVATVPGSPPVSVGTFTDQRGESPTWIGAIRNGYGSPVTNIELNEPAATRLQVFFADGLRARGFAVSDTGAPTQVSGIIRKLDCNQLATRDVKVEIEVNVTKPPSGVPTFTRIYSANNTEGSLLSGYSWGDSSVQALRTLTEKTLRQVVDKALDDPQLRSALQ